MSENPKIIIYRTDFEALQKGEKLENLKIFYSWENVDELHKDTPNAFFVEVELDLTREDIIKLFGTKGR